MDTYKCYYCILTFTIFGDLIEHLVDFHSTMCLKYREYELDIVTGRRGYRTKEFKKIIPAEGEVFITSDNKVGIYRGEEKNKKTKMNTPVKCVEKSHAIETESSATATDQPSDTGIDTLLQEMEMDRLQDSEDRAGYSELINCIPTVLENLKENGHLKTFKKFCELIRQKKFPMSNIGFLLFLDIVDWFSCNSTSEMRYLRQQTRQFWEVGYRLFKGKFLRFMSGPKNAGEIVKGVEERGQCSSERSAINFAVPSVQTLSKEKINPILPGVIENSITNLSECLDSKYIKIGVDGKKIARGKGKLVGDIDCWGFEPSPTLKEKADRYRRENSQIEEAINMIDSFVEKDHQFIPDSGIQNVIHILQNLILMISNRIKDLRSVAVRLQLGIQKFMKLGDQSAKHWSKSRYAPVISSLKVNNYDAEQAIESSLRIIKEFGYFCSILNGCEHCYSKNDSVDVTKHEKYHQLKSDIPGEDPKTTKQKSETWFSLRGNATVTGSTCNTALGLGKLKDMQSHFDKVKSGTDNRQFTETQLKNMRYGTEHEIDGIATVAARILPCMFPSTEYFEEGCISISDDTNPFFMIVSPDGSLRESNNDRPTMMYENKCKIESCYSTPVYYEIPKYYIPQLLCEMFSYNCDELLFTCWSKNSTTAFKVFFDKELWTAIWGQLTVVYSGEKCKRPSKFPDCKRNLEKMIDEFQQKNVVFIGEFPSCNAAFTPSDVTYDGESVYTTTQVSAQGYREVQCDVILKSLHELSRTLDDIYKICRTSASEILVFMACDLNRTYHAEMNNAHPIAYALKGASMTNEVFGKMLDHVIQKCEEKGLEVIATASDGQWHKYGIRGHENKPLTLYQLQRDIWKEKISCSISDIRKYIRNLCKVSSGKLENVEVSRDMSRLTISHATDKPLKVFQCCHLKWETDNNIEAPDINITKLDDDAVVESNDILSTVETFAPSLEIDENIITDLGRNTDVCSHGTADIDTATGNYLRSLFEDDNDSIFLSSLTQKTHTSDQLNQMHYLEESVHNIDEPFSTLTLTTVSENQSNFEHTSTVMGDAYSLLYGEPDIGETCKPEIEYSSHPSTQDTYDTEIIFPVQNNENNISNTDRVANESDFISKCGVMLSKLQSRYNARHEEWMGYSLTHFGDLVSEKSTCCAKMHKNELLMCIQELNSQKNTTVNFFKSWTKSKLYDSLLPALLSEHCTSNVPPERQGRRNPEKLTKLLSKWLNKVPKQTLAIVMAQNSFQDSYSKWLSESIIPHDKILIGSQFRSWFSLPSGSDTARFHFDDCCHILTCLRVKLCTTGISGLQKSAWDKAAISESTKLNIAIVRECIDKQSVPFARRMFEEDVEMFMRRNNFPREADFVHLIRQWFEAEDSPGIPAVDRCIRRLKLRDYLLEGVNFASFPPVTQYMKGIPIVTYESLLVHLERKLQIFQFVPERKYNVRALGTQEVEQFFSTIRDMDPSGQGTPKPDDIPDIMATAAFLDNTRMAPDRSFHFKTSRAPVYPDVLLERPCNDSSDEEPTDDVVDHFFDTQARLRRKQKRKSGLVSSPSQPAHRQMGVRQYHTCREDKLLSHHRKGLPDI